jgi:hypothetical protein
MAGFGRHGASGRAQTLPPVSPNLSPRLTGSARVTLTHPPGADCPEFSSSTPFILPAGPGAYAPFSSQVKLMPWSHMHKPPGRALASFASRASHGQVLFPGPTICRPGLGPLQRYSILLWTGFGSFGSDSGGHPGLKMTRGMFTQTYRFASTIFNSCLGPSRRSTVTRETNLTLHWAAHPGPSECHLCLDPMIGPAATTRSVFVFGILKRCLEEDAEEAQRRMRASHLSS